MIRGGGGGGGGNVTSEHTERKEHGGGRKEGTRHERREGLDSARQTERGYKHLYLGNANFASLQKWTKKKEKRKKLKV